MGVLYFSEFSEIPPKIRKMQYPNIVFSLIYHWFFIRNVCKFPKLHDSENSNQKNSENYTNRKVPVIQCLQPMFLRVLISWFYGRSRKKNQYTVSVLKVIQKYIFWEKKNSTRLGIDPGPSGWQADAPTLTPPYRLIVKERQAFSCNSSKQWPTARYWCLTVVETLVREC